MALCHAARAIPFKPAQNQFKLLDGPDRPPPFSTSQLSILFSAQWQGPFTANARCPGSA